VVAALGLIALGALAGVAVVWDDPPAVLVDADPGGTVPVGFIGFDDKQMVSVGLFVGPRRALQAPVDGQVTGFACTVGAEIASGQSVVSIDGRPVLSLATAMPLWRDLERDARGWDVAGLAQELKRLGDLAPESPEVVDDALLTAYGAAARRIGLPDADLGGGLIRARQVAWLPAPSLPAGSCDAMVGSRVAAGHALIGFAPQLVGAQVGSVASSLAPGDRTLLVGGEVFAVSPDQEIADPEMLARLGALPATRAALSETGNGILSGQLALAEPINAGVVPPAAVVASGGTACVVGDGTPQPVTVIGSQLGQTFIVFDGQPPEAVALHPPRDLTCQ
jgi:hypothetical protein